MTAEKQTTEQNIRGTKVAVVAAISGAKTVRVVVESFMRDRRYGKTLRRRRRMAVHDPARIAKVGDVVEIVPCRRLSRTKSWRLVRVIRSGGMPELIA